MRVKAKHWLNYNGVWHKGGDTFEADNFDEIQEHVEKVDESQMETPYVSEIFPPIEQPKRRGRPKKAED